MKHGSLLKKIAVIATVSAVITSTIPVSVMADARQELEGAMYTQRVTYLTNRLGACAEETRIAEEYLGGLKSLAKVNASYAALIPAAEQRLAAAVRAQRSAQAALGLAKDPQADASESNALPANKKHTIGIVSRDGQVGEYFTVETTGAPTNASSKLIISDFMDEHPEYDISDITVRYYKNERLAETSKQAAEAADESGTVIVSGRMSAGGCADQVAAESTVDEGRSLVFLWEKDGRVSVVDND